ncbi:MAG: 6-phosphofructokinase [Sphingobacteriales bacterium]|nr:MAG: 6-phosphofructokinase [Sphingobacteriales bacterium]
MTEKRINKIAVLTSGGDAPGMNACIRAVVRTAIHHRLYVSAIKRGYAGLIENDIEDNINSAYVSNIIQRGGTILETARSEDFKTPEGMKKAYEHLKASGIDGVIAIGGDGTLKGALEFTKQYPQIPFIGIPGTIDNDLYGTDYTIGYATAINTVIEAIDKIRDTASSHSRLFFIEVMGRDAGFIALSTGIGGGAEAILIPEAYLSIDALVEQLELFRMRKKKSSIVIVGEGDERGGAMEISKLVVSKLPQGLYDSRVTVLGHIQRGGSPVCQDRVLASRLGVAAVEALINGIENVMVGVIHDKIVYTNFNEAIKHNVTVDPELVRISKILSS